MDWLGRMKKFAMVSLFFAYSGCNAVQEFFDGLEPEEEAEVQRVLISVQQGSLEAALLVALTRDVEIIDSESGMAADAGARIESVFEPETCVQSTVLADTVNLLFDGCSGPYGIQNLNGAATLAFAVSALGSTAVSLSSADVKTNGASLALNVTGDMRDENGQRRWDLVTSGAGISQDLEPITRSGSFLGKLVNECLEMDGGWNSTQGEAISGVTFARLKRCQEACPHSGTVAVGSLEPSENIESEGRALTLTFQGNESVGWASTDGKGGITFVDCK